MHNCEKFLTTLTPEQLLVLRVAAAAEGDRHLAALKEQFTRLNIIPTEPSNGNS